MQSQLSDAQRQRRQQLQNEHWQAGLRGFVSRAAILHASKLVTLAAFNVGMHQPGALGWLLTGVPVGKHAHGILRQARPRHPVAGCHAAASTASASPEDS